MFFSSVSYIGELQFVSLGHLYILSLNLIEFIIPIVIHFFNVCNDLIGLRGFRVFVLANSILFLINCM